MNYEEKYNEILEWARKNKARLNGVPIEEVLPELAESEDERIRRKMIEHFRSKTKETWCNIPVKDIIAYLEKQKEQKPAEWSEGDEKDMAHIIRILDDCYVYGTHDLSKTDYENLVNKLKSLRPQYHGDVTMTEAYKMGLEAGKASSWKPSEEDLMMLEHIIGQYEIGNKNSKVMGYLPRIEELDFLKKVLAKWKN